MTKIEAWIQATKLVEPVVKNYRLQSYARNPGIFGNVGTVTAVEQYIQHIKEIAEWLLDNDREESFVTSVLRVRNDDEPWLGKARTRELLTELAVRMKITQNSHKGRDLGVLCREALDKLDPGVLDYRPWHPSEEGESQDHISELTENNL